ncbi:MAG: hypothetical protein VX640_07290 [Pseudomonadota bacterium]|nr:hypothetical protein [Pseudomonadota bacterium]
MTKTFKTAIAAAMFSAAFVSAPAFAEDAPAAGQIDVAKVNAMMDDMRERTLVMISARTEQSMEARLAKIENKFDDADRKDDWSTFAGF